VVRIRGPVVGAGRVVRAVPVAAVVRAVRAVPAARTVPVAQAARVVSEDDLSAVVRVHRPVVRAVPARAVRVARAALVAAVAQVVSGDDLRAALRVPGPVARAALTALDPAVRAVLGAAVAAAMRAGKQMARHGVPRPREARHFRAERLWWAAERQPEHKATRAVAGRPQVRKAATQDGTSSEAKRVKEREAELRLTLMRAASGSNLPVEILASHRSRTQQISKDPRRRMRSWLDLLLLFLQDTAVVPVELQEEAAADSRRRVRPRRGMARVPRRWAAG
jgi:hypothetical protein